MSKKTYLIPFSKFGNMKRDVYGSGTIVWKDNYTFSGSLTYEGYGRGRSAVYFIWKDDEGQILYMSLSVMNELLSSYYSIVGGKTNPNIEWTFVKQGQSYSIKIVE